MPTIPMLGYLYNIFQFDETLAICGLLALIVHLLLAVGVWGDAHALLLEKRYLYILKPWGWGLTCLVTGILGTATYWLMNRSTLRRD